MHSSYAEKKIDDVVSIVLVFDRLKRQTIFKLTRFILKVHFILADTVYENSGFMLIAKHDLVSYTGRQTEATMSHPPENPEKMGDLDNPMTGLGSTLQPTEGKNLAAQLLGQKGGLRRAETMSPERRSEIARAAARRRWEKGLSE